MGEEEIGRDELVFINIEGRSVFALLNPEGPLRTCSMFLSL